MPCESGIKARMYTIKDVLRLDLGGRWYVRVLKVCIALVGSLVLLAVVFFVYGFVYGFLKGFFQEVTHLLR
jgi:hypothetical protein